MFSDEQWRLFIAQYYWSVLEAPPKEEWKGADGTIAIILDQLRIPHGSYNSVRQVLRDIDDATERVEEYNAARWASGGQNKLIVHGSDDEQVIADQIMHRGPYNPKCVFFGWARAVVFQNTNVPFSHSDEVL